MFCSLNVNPACPCIWPLVFLVSQSCVARTFLSDAIGFKLLSVAARARSMALAALTRSCGLELARGLSTGLTVAAASRCPSCSPVVHCGAPPAPTVCPSCVCGEQPRLSAVCPEAPGCLLAVVLALVLGVLVGVVAHAIWSARSWVAKTPKAVRGVWHDVGGADPTPRPLPRLSDRVPR